MHTATAPLRRCATVVITARDDTHDIVAALEAGTDDYLVKPVAIRSSSRSCARRHRARAASADPVRVLRRRAGRSTGGREVHQHDAAVSVTRTGSTRSASWPSIRASVLNNSSSCNGCGSTEGGEERLVDVRVGGLRQKIEDEHRARGSPSEALGSKL
jgi:DNA-binding response OmpR family regulator